MRMKIGTLLKTAPMGIIGVFIAGLCMNAFRGMGPTFGQDVGLTPAGISAIMAVTTVGGLALQWPMGLLSDKMDRRKVILWASLGAGIIALVIGFSGVVSLRVLCSCLVDWVFQCMPSALPTRMIMYNRENLWLPPVQ